MVDPHSAVTGSNAIVSVLVFIGSQLSPSVMIRRAVKKELKVAALLKESGSIIDPDDWEQIIRNQEVVEGTKLNVPRWGEVIKNPVKLFLEARDYHDATCACLFEVRSASARATIRAAHASAMQSHASNALAAKDDTSSQDSDTTSYPSGSEGNVESDIASIFSSTLGSFPSYESVTQIVDTFTTRLDNIVVIAGAKTRVILHFGVGSVPVVINPLEQFADMPAWYTGPLVLSGYVTLVPCDDPNRVPDILLGHYKSGYDIEFSRMNWSVPPDHHVRVSSCDEADSVSLASHEATYGGDRTSMLMLDDGKRHKKLNCQACQAGYSSR